MRELLSRAGYRIRSGKRADCPHCTGSSRGTVAYTDEVAYCHRCGWRSNRVQLERELGLRPNSKAGQRRAVPTLAQKAAAERRRQVAAEVASIEKWVSEKLTIVADRTRGLHRLRRQIEAVLAQYPDRDYAWGALACVIRKQRQVEAEWEFYWARRCRCSSMGRPP